MAELTFTYARDANPVERSAQVELEGTAILDGTVATDLVSEPSGTATDLTVGAVSGTILVGVRMRAGWTGGVIGLDPISVPITFVVNRCDPHALDLEAIVENCQATLPEG